MFDDDGDLTDATWIDRLIEHLESRDRPHCAVLSVVDAVDEFILWIEDDRPFVGHHTSAWHSMDDELRAAEAASGSAVQWLVGDRLAELDIGTAISRARESAPRVREHDLLCQVRALLLSDDGVRACLSDVVDAARCGSDRDLNLCSQALWSTLGARGEDLGRRIPQICCLLAGSLDAETARLGVGTAAVSVASEHMSAAGMSLADRVALCADLLCSSSAQGDYVVWFAVDLATMRRGLAEAGPISFYDSGTVVALLRDPQHQETPYLPSELRGSGLSPASFPTGDLMLLARVDMGTRGGSFVEDDARQMLSAVLAPIERSFADDIHVLPGSVTFCDGRLVGWQLFDEELWKRQSGPTRLDYVLDDWLETDGERLAVALQAGTNPELERFCRLVQWDVAHRVPDPLATVVIAVRTIETVAQAHLAGTHWFKLMCSYESDLAWGSLASELSREARSALVERDHLPDDAQVRFTAIEGDVTERRRSREILNLRAFVDHLPELCNLWGVQCPPKVQALTRCLELWTSVVVFAERLAVAQADVNLLLNRVHRIRNAAQHGGPITEASVRSVARVIDRLRRTILADLLDGLAAGRSCRETIEALKQRTEERDRLLQSGEAPIVGLDTPVSYD